MSSAHTILADAGINKADIWGRHACTTHHLGQHSIGTLGPLLQHAIEHVYAN